MNLVDTRSQKNKLIKRGVISYFEITPLFDLTDKVRVQNDK